MSSLLETTLMIPRVVLRSVFLCYFFSLSPFPSEKASLKLQDSIGGVALVVQVLFPETGGPAHPYLGPCPQPAGWVQPYSGAQNSCKHGTWSGLSSDTWTEIFASSVHNEVAPKEKNKLCTFINFSKGSLNKMGAFTRKKNWKWIILINSQATWRWFKNILPEAKRRG